MDADVVIIGAGVVGLAVAARLARAGMRVVVLERHRTFGQETSSRNSEVIHAGFYYPTGSLKARLCVSGRRALYRWCAERGVGHSRVGKYVVAENADEEAYLGRLLERARANGVEGMRWAGPGELAREEPEVVAHSAIFSAETGIVDSHGLMQSLLGEAVDHGALFAWRHDYACVKTAGRGFRVRFRNPDGQPDDIATPRVVNAGGLVADEIAASAGIDLDAAGYRLAYVRGRYFRLSEAKRGLCRHLIYPVPPATPVGHAGLGIHVTLDLAGGLRLGPDIEFLSDRRADYAVDESLAEVFARTAGRYLRSFTVDDLRPDQAGIRPRRSVPGVEMPDFVIAEESARGLPGWVNLVGIESPGLTSCLAIADEVAGLYDAAAEHSD